MVKKRMATILDMPDLTRTPMIMVDTPGVSVDPIGHS